MLEGAPDFWRAAVLGFCVAAPIGPVGALCISRSFNGGATLGLATGLGAATVHVAWAFVASIGVATILVSDPTVSALCSIIAGASMLYMGHRTLKRVGAIPALSRSTPQLLEATAAYASGLTVAAANPATGLIFIAAVPSFVGLGGSEAAPATMVAAGTFVGSATWWLALSLGLAAVQGRVPQRAISLIDRGAGAILVCLAALLVSRGMWLLGL